MPDEENSVVARIDDIRKNSNRKSFEKWREIGEMVCQDMRQQGSFFNTPQGFFLFDSEHRRTVPLQRGDIGLESLMVERYGINAAEREFAQVLVRLRSEAYLRGKKVTVHRLAHYCQDSKRLYVSRFDGQMYRLDGKSVEQLPNGSDGVFFFDNDSWEPYEYVQGSSQGQLDRILFDPISFSEDFNLSAPEQRRLMKLWCLASFFTTLHPTKPLLLLVGEKGGGKSLGLRKFLWMLFGERANVHALERSKPDGFVAAVTSEPIVVFDNVDERVSWLPDSLARLATGADFSRRQLYTTNEIATFKGISWVALSALTGRFLESRDDVADRTLVLRTRRLEGFIRESKLLAEVLQCRNQLMSELLEELQAIVGHLASAAEIPSVSIRMADFASFALQVGALWGCREEIEETFQKLEQAQIELVTEEEPIVQMLEYWLEDKLNHGRVVDCKTLYRELSVLARERRLKWPYQSSRSLAQRLHHLRDNLKLAFDVIIDTNPSSNTHTYSFRPYEQEENVGLSYQDIKL